MSNNALQLDGSTMYGTVNNYTAINKLTAYTIEGWFYQHDASTSFALAASIAKSDGSADFMEFQRDTTGAGFCNFGTVHATTNADGVSNSGPFTTDTWVYCAVVFNPAPFGDGKTHIYFGATPTEVGYSLERTAAGAQQDPTGFNFYMGYDPHDAGSGKWLGNIGGFLRLWNVARTTAQLGKYYNLNLNSQSEINLILNLNFFEGAGTVVHNDYTSGNDMLLTGSPTWVTGPSVTPYVYPTPFIKSLRPAIYKPG